MLPNTIDTLDAKFPVDAINHQLKKILLDPFFINSPILTKFLLFIVEQTLTGNKNWIKEYTIGIHVLDKPVNFNPRENGIVRIHAARLRRALHYYYSTTGMADSIKIVIPKGRYVPLFLDNNYQVITEELNEPNSIIGTTPPGLLSKKTESIAVLPFEHLYDNILDDSIVDGIGLQLSNELMQLEKYSVIPYRTMHDLWLKTKNNLKAAALTDARYLITGGIQVLKNELRVHVQFIDLSDSKQLLSCMYEGELSSKHIFELQDEIVQFVFLEMIRSRKLDIDDKTLQRYLIAVA